MKVSFGRGSTPFLFGATVNYHYHYEGKEFQETILTLRQNTYMDNLMVTMEDNI